jgi:hypothetical protein
MTKQLLDLYTKYMAGRILVSAGEDKMFDARHELTKLSETHPELAEFTGPYHDYTFNFDAFRDAADAELTVSFDTPNLNQH